jgi:UDP-N-acetylmuramate dehydrogenase
VFIKAVDPVVIKENEVLSPYTTLKIGGPARYFARVTSQKELILLIEKAQEYKIPYFILGGGTNTLISDSGVDLLVIKNDTNAIRMTAVAGIRKASDILSPQKKVFLEVDSGVGVNRLVRYTLDEGLSGLETFLGQPGSVGGGIYMNAHNMKWGTFIGDRVHSAKIVTHKGEIKVVDKSYFKFGYDESVIQKTKDTVVSIIFMLESKEKEEIWKVGNDVSEYRKKTQPWGVLSAGCTFRNIAKSDAMRLATPNYTTSAGYLIDSVGLKGTQIGGCTVSDSHANFITVKPQSKASDMIQLISVVSKKVYKKFRIRLKPEIVMLGEFDA